MRLSLYVFNVMLSGVGEAEMMELGAVQLDVSLFMLPKMYVTVSNFEIHGSVCCVLQQGMCCTVLPRYVAVLHCTT